MLSLWAQSLGRSCTHHQFKVDQQWIAYAISGAVIGLALGSTLLAWRTGRTQRSSINQALELVQQQAKEPNQSSLLSSDRFTNAANFTRSLPSQPPVETLASALDRTTKGANVVLTSIQVQPYAVQDGQLRTTDLSVVLRGSYPQLKQSLQDLLDSHPAVTVQRLGLRRTSTPRDVEVSVVFRAWAMPADLTASGTATASGDH
jgi:Tfp pilus assembly protein PilO